MIPAQGGVGIDLTLAHIAALKQRLQVNMLGQINAVESLTDALAKSIYQAKQGGPLGVFLFAGPSATGKSYLAQQLVEALGNDWGHITIAMSSLTQENQSADLDGTEPSYGNAQPGRLTSHVRQHPRSVILLEDPDEAHPAVLSRLVPMLNSGVMRDRFGFYEKNDTDTPPLAPPDVDFSQTLVILTTRAGRDAYEDANFQRLADKNPSHAADMLLAELAKLKSTLSGDGGSRGLPQFPPGLLDRLAAGSVLLFRPLDLDYLCTVARRRFAISSKLFSERLGCLVQIEPLNDAELFKAIVLTQGPEPDARKVLQAVSAHLLDPITDHMLAHQDSAHNILCKSVSWQLSEASRARLTQLLGDLGSSEPLRALMRGGLKLQLKCMLAQRGDVMRAVVESIATQRVTQASDVRGMGAVRVEVPEISFDQIAGHHRIKERLKEVVHLMKFPSLIRSFGVSVPKGVLLYGPPGTGKTMLAKALAHEAGLPFIATTGAELLNLAFLRTLFQRARKYAPSIVFVDEVDTLGSRDAGGYDVVINQLLMELDGFDTGLSEPVFIVAATNRKDKLDPALMRAGRIDIHVEVPQLDRDARAHFIERYLALPNDGSLQRDILLSQTSGMSGAEMEQARREVVLDMVRSEQIQISQGMLLDHINQQKYGPKTNTQRNDLHREMTAYHEAGHAVISMFMNPDVAIEQVTITSRGAAGGFVAFEQNIELTRRMTRKEIMDEVCVLLAGRLSEQLQFGDEGLSAGASSDLARATQLTEAAITQFGLDEKVGLVATAHLSEHSQAGFEALVAQQIAYWINDAQLKCTKALEQHWVQVQGIAEHLISNESITGEDARIEMSKTRGVRID